MTEKTHHSHSATSAVGNDEIDIGRLLGTIIEARWWVLGITALFALAALVYCMFATPIYSADALVQIEQNTGSSLVQDINSALSNKPPASEAEIQLIQSRLVLGKTVVQLIPLLSPQGNERVIKKYYFTIPPETLAEIKKTLFESKEEQKEIEVVGIETNLCVLSNLIGLQSAFPEADFFVDPTLVSSRKHGESALELLKDFNVSIIEPKK